MEEGVEKEKEKEKINLPSKRYSFPFFSEERKERKKKHSLTLYV